MHSWELRLSFWRGASGFTLIVMGAAKDGNRHDWRGVSAPSRGLAGLADPARAHVRRWSTWPGGVLFSVGARPSPQTPAPSVAVF
jgi:hypothetical protein